MGSLLDWLVQHDENFRRARLPSLYADFLRTKATNPDGYAANIAAWYSGLCRAALMGGMASGRRLTLAIDSRLLASLHSPAYGTPAGALHAVVDECTVKGQLIPEEIFLARATSIYERRWRLPELPSPAAAATWAVRQVPGIGTLLLGDAKKEDPYVLVANVEAMAAQLERYLSASRDRLERLIPLELFQQEVSRELGYEGGRSIADSDLKILLRHLDRDKRRLVANERLVKLLPSTATDAERAITSQDQDLANLKALQVKLSEQEATLMQRIQDLTADAKTQLAQSNKPAALRALRRRKMNDAMLEKRTSTLSQVEGVLARIQEASDNVATVKALEGGAAALKSLNRETGGIETVDKIMDQLQEEMDTAGEINQAIQSTVPIVDEVEVDDELEAMEREANMKREQEAVQSTKQDLSEIPTVPDTIVDKGQVETERDLQEDIAALQQLSVSDISEKTQEAERRQAPATAT